MEDGRTRVKYEDGEEHRYWPTSLHKLSLLDADQAPAAAPTSLYHTLAPIKRFQLAALGLSRFTHLSHARDAAPKEIEVVSSSAPDELGGTAKPAAEPASPANETSFGTRSSKAPQEPTHFLLYLTKKTFMGLKGKGLAHEVRTARAAGLPVVLVHENDGARDGCAFDTLFQTTPQELIDGGLYNTLAVPFMSGDAHRKLSRALLAKELGAQEKKSRALYRLSSAGARSIRGDASATVAQEQNV